MYFIHFYILLIISITCYAGPLEDLASMPDLSLFYQQLLRQQDIQMVLQGLYPQQQPGGMNDFTIFAPNNDAMINLNRKNEDLNLLWKYHIVSGRYDEQILFNMAQEKYNQANPRQMIGIRPQNNLPTIALPFQVFYGYGFYGGTGPQVNETFDNAGYGSGGISWLTHTSLNQTNVFENNIPMNPFILDNYDRSVKYGAGQGNTLPRNPNLTNYYGNNFNPNLNRQKRQTPNMNFIPNLQQQQQNYGQLGPNGGIGVLRPTINNAFVLQSRPMSRGVINVIDNILWPPERRDQAQYKTAYDALEDAQFSRLRQLAERSDYFRSELRSIHHQTWFLPNDQAFASMGSSLSYLLDQSSMNNTNDINEFVKAHVIPLVLYPSAMDSTKQVITLIANQWITFRKVTQPDQTFQVDVVCGRFVARILNSRSEDIRLYGNGIVYPISTILTSQVRSATDELTRNYQYFMNLVQQTGDLELINLLQGTMNQNFNSQNAPNITVLIPQQMSIQQIGSAQELSLNLRRHILRFPVYMDQITGTSAGSNSFPQQNIYQTGQQQQPLLQPGFNQQQQQQPLLQPGFNQQQQQPFLQPGLNQQQFQIPQFQRAASGSDKKQSRRRRQLNTPSYTPSYTNFQIQQFPQQQLPNQQILPNQQQQQRQQFPQQQLPNSQQQLPNQQILPNQQQQQQFPQQQLPNTQQQLPNQQKQYLQQQLPNLQHQLPNQQILPIQQQQQQQQFPQQQLPNPQQQLPNQQILPIQQQQQQIDPNYYQMPSSSLAVFQNGQVYPTMDPQYTVQAQVSPGTRGNVVTLIGRSANSLPFTATILNSESNIPIKNGVMHVIRGLVSGTVIPIDGVLLAVQGANAFTQLLQQTRVIEQLKQTGRSYTLFIPTNAALQSMGVTTDINRLRQFVLRHICADVILDPHNNIVRRSAGFYSRNQNSLQKRPRQKRQGWMNNQPNQTNRQGFQSPDLGPGYFQPQQQAYGGYPAASTPYGSNNQLYNPSNVINGYASPNSQYFPNNNGTNFGNQNNNFNNIGIPPNQPMPNTFWNRTMNTPYNRQGMAGPNDGAHNYYTASGGYLGGSNSNSGQQSCRAMTGERITVQSLGGTQSEGNTPSMSYQNFMVTCCGDQSVNSMVQSFNIYPPNFAVYLIGRPLLSQGQTINTMYNYSSKLVPSSIIFFFFIISIIFQQIHDF
ncbi:unnamed protein product [Adineta steineri]|uniref:FAS1 domain-containing protein n=1 Tax=Adineta steineri TaxID=433720 RepID=A0A819RN35_9BILA|nr:unnamed protein product [Adineta steineri]